MKKRISKILIGNRGEIACRIARTANKMGIKTVAIYSEADKKSLHLKMCDEAFCIGAASSVESYLNQSKIIDVAKRASCEAIHPGYGFLSENAKFAELCGKNDLIFIGPSPSAIRDMGIKSTSKNIMSAAGVPIIEGYHGTDQSDDTLFGEATKIGYPLMIKAVKGGGGKGMRIVSHENQFSEQLNSARRESANAFGDDSVLLEKYVVSPRHIEVQVFGDHCGNIVHLYERDCSVQRRHQKVLEEAPASGLSDNLRSEICDAAVCAARAVNYVGAGTVEFMLDASSERFYFMEMNTRLQVEHPITEMITSTDLVEWQIKVAAGEELPLKQDDIPLRGHAIETRIYAESPANQFTPMTGTITHLSLPLIDRNTRIETGVREGDEISVHYDPMIAKLVVWATDRSSAFKKLYEKLSNYHITGVETNIEFLKNMSQDEHLLNGCINTDFIAARKDNILKIAVPSREILIQAAMAIILRENEKEMKLSLKSEDKFSPWSAFGGFRVNYCYSRTFEFVSDTRDVGKITVKFGRNGNYVITSDDGSELTVRANLSGCSNGDYYKITTDFTTQIVEAKVVFENDSVDIFHKGNHFKLGLKVAKYREDSVLRSSSETVSPLPGIVDKVMVKVGDAIKVGDPVVVIIAMKMENVVKATRDGIIKSILFKPGETIKKNEPILEMEK